ncbi:MAG: hypothetical protein ACRERE_23485 [Candidatus Entotheonellia bacterium]
MKHLASWKAARGWKHGSHVRPELVPVTFVPFERDEPFPFVRLPSAQADEFTHCCQRRIGQEFLNGSSALEQFFA